METAYLDLKKTISYELLQSSPLYVKIIEPISKDKIKHRSIQNEFKLLKLLFSSKKYQDNMLMEKSYKQFNRYKDITPLKNNLVTIDKQPLCLSNYIHANLIVNPVLKINGGAEFIATQGPIDKTIESFWKMVLNHNIGSIICIVEDHLIGKKCSMYWTDQEEKFGDITIICKSISENDICEVREITIINKRTEETHDTIHYHFKHWNDKMEPKEEHYNLYLDFYKLLHQDFQTTNSPVIVHCSAGVGRTGTFIASYYTYELFKQSQEQDEEYLFSVFEIARGVREQRSQAISTFKQYRFIYDMIRLFN